MTSAAEGDGVCESITIGVALRGEGGASVLLSPGVFAALVGADEISPSVGVAEIGVAEMWLVGPGLAGTSGVEAEFEPKVFDGAWDWLSPGPGGVLVGVAPISGL